MTSLEKSELQSINSYLASLDFQKINELRNEILSTMRNLTTDANEDKVVIHKVKQIVAERKDPDAALNINRSKGQNFTAFKYVFDPNLQRLHKNDYDGVKFVIGTSPEQIYKFKHQLDEKDQLSPKQKEEANKTYKIVESRLCNRGLYDVFEALLVTILSPKNKHSTIIQGNNSYAIKPYNTLNEMQKDLNIIENKLLPQNLRNLKDKEKKELESAKPILQKRINDYIEISDVLDQYTRERYLILSKDKKDITDKTNDKDIETRKKIHRSMNLNYLETKLNQEKESNKIQSYKEQINKVQNRLEFVETKISEYKSKLNSILKPSKSFSTMSSLMARVARVNNFACTGRWFCPECGKEMKSSKHCDYCGANC